VSTLLELEREALGCVACPLSEGRTNVVFGVGNPDADLMFVGEAPGRDEDLKGEPFVGRSGQLLDKVMLEELGSGREKFFIANVLMCRPPGNRDPLPDEIAHCRPFLEQKIEVIDPKVLITLGNFATRLLLDTKEGITKLRGRTHRYGKRLLVPTFHPSAVLRSGGGEPLAKMRADFIRAKQALAGAPDALAEGRS
jgi:DNA polymerase